MKKDLNVFPMFLNLTYQIMQIFKGANDLNVFPVFLDVTRQIMQIFKSANYDTIYDTIYDTYMTP